MEKPISQILELFKHLVRDILIYLVSGLLLLTNSLLLDFCYFEGRFLNFMKTIEYLPLILIIVSYSLGQIITGFMYLVIEQTKIEWLITKIMKINPNINLIGEIEIYLKDKDVYDYFIERYNHLYYLRWNMAGASLIVVIANAIFLIFVKYCSIVMIVSIISFLSFIFLLVVHYKTGEDYNSRIDKITILLSKKE